MPVWAYTAEFTSSSFYIAFFFQQIFLFSALIYIDFHFNKREVRFITASIALVHTGFTLFNAFLMNITFITLYESIITLATGGSFLKTLEEIGLSTGFLIILFTLVAIVFSFGGIINHYVPKLLRPVKVQKIWLIILISASVLYVSEQVFMHNDTSYHARREIPLYFKIFSTSNETIEIKLPQPLSNTEIDSYLSGVSKAKNPKNVIYVVLESFRKDMINKKNAPNMKNIKDQGFSFPISYGDATYTSLSFNTLFFDMPAYTFPRDAAVFTKKTSGSLPFKIMQKAGYKTHLVTSANFEWKNFHNRINGSNNAIDYFYSPFTIEMATKRQLLDYKVLGKVKEILNTKTKKPKFIMIQLDSSHWTYFFGKEAEIEKQYPPVNINVAKLSNQEDIDQIYKRYVNSVKQVDIVFGKMIDHLKKTGLYNSTAIIVAGDHGEGFKVRMVGHSVLHKDIKMVPIFMRFPGTKPKVFSKRISHKNIYPTLYDYLKISGIKNKMNLGTTIYDKSKNKGILITHGSTLQAELNYPDYMIQYIISVDTKTISFTPYRYLTIDRKPVTDKAILKMLKKRWQKDLPEIIKKK